MTLEPADSKEARIFAIEDFRAEIQYAILRQMKASGVSQSQLAQRLGVSQAWVSQILGDDANLTAETIAKIFFALGMKCGIRTELWEGVEEDCEVLEDFDEMESVAGQPPGAVVGGGVAAADWTTAMPRRLDVSDRKSNDTASMLLHAIQQNCRTRPMMVANDHNSSRQKVKRVVEVAA